MQHQLNYFAVDLDIINDPRIRKLTADQGGIALSIYLLVLSRVYSAGYFYMLTDADIDSISSDLHCKRTSVIESVRACFRIGLFTKINDSVSIITSPSIQRRYIQLCKLTGTTPVFTEHKLIDNCIESGRFPPTVEDVTLELTSHNWVGIIDPSEFIGYYSSIDWKIKGEPVADWKVKLSKWVDRRLHPQHKRRSSQQPKAVEPYREYKPKKLPEGSPMPPEVREALIKRGLLKE